MVDIFDEVDEELRAERAKNLLMRYSGVIAAVALLVVGVVAGWQAWQWWQNRQDVAAANAYVAAMASADASANLEPAARTALIGTFDTLVSKAPSGYRTLVKLREAALKADAGDIAGAAALWDQIAGDSAVDPLLRDLATLLWAERQIDRGDPALLTARLKPLTDPGNAWRSLAQEQLALLDLRQGKLEAAKATLRKLSQDVSASSGVRGRSAALLSRLEG